MELVLLIGLQGSGKSTFYRRTFASTHVLVSKDNFRNNRRPQRRQMHLIEEALKQGHSVVVDNTNPTLEDRAAITGLAKAHGATICGFYFDAPLADCLERNRRRSSKARVPDAALHITSKRMRPPLVDEGFDRLHRVRISSDNAFSIREWPEGNAQ